MRRFLSFLLLTTLLTTPAFGQQQTTLQKIKTTKMITLGYRESSFPFSFVGEDKKACRIFGRALHSRGGWRSTAARPSRFGHQMGGCHAGEPHHHGD